MQHYTLCHGKQIAQTFFSLACCLMVLHLIILSLTLEFTNKSSWLVIPFHCHRKKGTVGAYNYLPKRGNHLCAVYTSSLQAGLAILCRFMMIILYLYYRNSKRYQHITARPSKVLFGCLTPGLWLLCNVWRLQMEEAVKHQITLFTTAPLIPMLQPLGSMGWVKKEPAGIKRRYEPAEWRHGEMYFIPQTPAGEFLHEARYWSYFPK